MPLAPLLRLGLLAATLLFVAAPAASASEATSPTAILREMNRARVANGVRPLRVAPSLQRAAADYSRTLLRTNVFTHGDFAGRIRRYSPPGSTAGENLAWGVGSGATAHSIVASWLSSPGHRANLLRPGFRWVGVGAAVGSFGGYRGATVVTADFAGS